MWRVEESCVDAFIVTTVLLPILCWPHWDNYQWESGHSSTLKAYLSKQKNWNTITCPHLCYSEHGMRVPCSKTYALSRRLFVIMPKITSLFEPVFDLWLRVGLRNQVINYHNCNHNLFYKQSASLPSPDQVTNLKIDDFSCCLSPARVVASAFELCTSQRTMPASHSVPLSFTYRSLMPYLTRLRQDTQQVWNG